MLDLNKIILEEPTFKEFVSDSKRFGDKHVIVMMSGGVDSSVTALMLKEEGWNVCGVTMRIPVAEKCDVKRSCCGVEAAYVSRQLDIPHYYLDVREIFHQCVIEPFQEDYKNGITPSPCVDCNESIKFRYAWDFLRSRFGVNKLATGHYARIYSDAKGFHLARGRDISRDQSYFLYGIKKERLSDLLFPLEPYTKDETRAMARKAGLKVAAKPDSMELCFAGEGDYRNAIGHASGRGGVIVDTSGKILRHHEAIENFTIGQRKGLGISASYPLYVIRIDPENNTIVVGTYDEGLDTVIKAGKINVLEPEAAIKGARLFGKIRSTGSPKPCVISELNPDIMEVEFEEPFFVTSPGQKIVLYDEDDRIILGGTIAI